MKENVNLISSSLPDLSTKALPKNDVLNSKGSEFNKTFDSALKRSEPKRNEAPVATSDRAAERASVAQEAKSEPVVSKKTLKNVSSADSVNSSANLKNTLSEEKESFDDDKGIMAQSYSETAVSYPVSRIAKDSIDEKTKASLEEQGLWNLPTVVAAQPSPQLLAMKEVATGFESDVESVPVSKPIAQFMASLENELGVKPDRLVQAFKSLKPGQLGLPPEKTMMQVVKNLKLNPADEAKALELYTKMLAQLQLQTESSIDAAKVAAAGGGFASLAQQQNGLQQTEVKDVPVKGQAKKEAAALGYAKADALSGANASAIPKDVASEAPKAVQVKEESAGDVFKTDAKDSKTEGKLQNQKQTFNGQMHAQPQKADVERPLSTNGMEPVTPAATAAIPQAKTDQAQADTSAQIQNNAQDVSAGQAGGMGAVVAKESGEKGSQSQSNGNGSRNLVKEMASKDKTTVSTKGMSETSTLSGAASNAQSTENAAPVLSKNEVALGSGSAALEMKKDGDPKHEAIRSIVNQAQMLASKGGGEIRMTLKPDHMGEIQLKVAMEGNKVNVQMTTDRSEVKKLIEQSVHELRHGLASHNLSMEKMDVALNQRDMGGFSKGQPDFSQARDFNQSQFSQNQERRSQSEDLSALRRNSAQASVQASAKIDRTGQMQRAMKSQGKSSGRLNVVA